MPLYRLLKKSDKFTWTPEADVALGELKKMLQEAPVLAAPLGLDHNVVDIGVDVTTDLALQALLHAALVGRAAFFSPKGMDLKQ